MTRVTLEHFVGIYVYHDRKPGQTRNNLPSIEPVFCFPFENAKLYGPYYNGKEGSYEYWDLMIEGGVIYRRNSKRFFRIYTQGVVEEFRHLLANKNNIGPGYFCGRVQDLFTGDGEYDWKQGPVRIEIGAGKDKKAFFRKNGTFRWMNLETYQKFESHVSMLRRDRDCQIESAEDKGFVPYDPDLSDILNEHQKNISENYKEASIAKAQENYFVGVEKAIKEMLDVDTDRPCGHPCQGTGSSCRHSSALMQFNYANTFDLGKAICPIKHYANIDIKEQVGCTNCGYHEGFSDLGDCLGCEKYKGLLQVKETAQGIMYNAKKR